MEHICQNCLSWSALYTMNRSYGGELYKTTKGECSCEKFVYSYEQKPEQGHDEFHILDDCNQAIDFWPCSHFGCIHFQARS